MPASKNALSGIKHNRAVRIGCVIAASYFASLGIVSKAQYDARSNKYDVELMRSVVKDDKIVIAQDKRGLASYSNSLGPSCKITYVHPVIEDTTRSSNEGNPTPIYTSQVSEKDCKPKSQEVVANDLILYTDIKADLPYNKEILSRDQQLLEQTIASEHQSYGDIAEEYAPKMLGVELGIFLLGAAGLGYFRRDQEA